jgi:outer membrane receptor protein involved in Fe transport
MNGCLNEHPAETDIAGRTISIVKSELLSPSVPDRPWGRTEPTAPAIHRGFISLFAVLCLLLLTGVSVRAQLNTADVTGTVTDHTGAAVTSAQVTIKNLGTNQARAAVTNEAGNYAFTFLSPGRYSVRIEAPGFKVFDVRELILAGGDHGRADATLQLGATSETVEVVSQTPLLQADTSQLSSTITEEAVENLPIASRNLTELVFLAPGVNEGASVNGLSSGQRPDDRRLQSGFSVSGADPQLNNNQLDGTDNNERLIGTIGVKPSFDMIQEVTVETSNFTPETGRSAGGVLSVLTKSGSNRLHGDAYEYLTNDLTSARNAFNTSTSAPEQRTNIFGGSVGGPIYHDKTFFFASYEGYRDIEAFTPSVTWVPDAASHAAIQNGDVSSIINADPYTAGLPADQIAVNLASLYPAPNTSQTNGNFIYVPKQTRYATTLDGRIDHRLGSNDLLFGRFTSNNVSSYIPSGMPKALFQGTSIDLGNGQYGYSGPAQDNAYNAQLNYTHIFNQNLLLELKTAYTRVNNNSGGANTGTNAATKLGFPNNINFGPVATGLPWTGPDGFAPIGDSWFLPIVDLSNTFEYNGAVTYTRGRHNFKAGANLLRRQAQNQQSNNANGTISFAALSGTAAATPGNDYALAEFLTGAFSTEYRNIDLYTPNYRSWESGFYAQDTWRVSPKLTLVYGLRYDIYTPFTEVHGYLSNFDPRTDDLLVPSRALKALAAQGIDVSSLTPSSETAGVKTNYKNFAPRIGFSATVGPGTVLRGGAGITYYPGNYTSNASLKNAPFSALYNSYLPGSSTVCYSPLAVTIATAANNANDGSGAQNYPPCPTGSGLTTTLDQGIVVPPPQVLTSTGLSLPDSVDLNFRTSLAYQFHMEVQKQLGKNVLTIGYVGQLGRYIPVVVNDINVQKPQFATYDITNPLSSTGGCAPDQIPPAGFGAGWDCGALTIRPTGAQAANGGVPVPGQSPKSLPNLGGVGYYQSIGFSHYNALAVSLERRFSKGLTANINYTWSHAIDDATQLSNEGQEGFSNINPFDIGHTEAGNGDTDLRHRFVAATTYALPFFQNADRVAKTILGGWQINEVFVANSGSPFSITDNYGYPGNSIYLMDGPSRPMMTGDPHLSNPSVSEWFNRAAFHFPAIGQAGDTPRNNLYGPRYVNLDLSLGKTFAITERQRLEFRVVSSNFLNHPNFFVQNNQNNVATTNEPQAYYNTAPPTAFAQIVSMNPNYTPRVFQFALRYSF